MAVRLINLGWFRVGSDHYARTSRTFGITTIRKRHVRVRGSRVVFRYPGKRRAWVHTAIVDVELAETLRDLIDVPGGSRLFRYRWNGGLFNTPAVARASYVSPAVVERYLSGATLEDFRPRDLRVVGACDIDLDPEERARLSLLRSWRIKRARAVA